MSEDMYKFAIINRNKTIEELQSELDRLKEENERLKLEIESLKKWGLVGGERK